jgi:signal transduction histidine kinase
LDDVFSTPVFPGWRNYIRRVAARDSNPRPENLIARLSDGNRVFLVHVTRTSDSGGQVADTVVTLDDITDQRASERRFIELEKFAERGVMASSIAHELNNFLALILGGIELTRSAIDRDQLDKTLGALQSLKQHAQTMERFVSGLTDFSQMDSKKTSADLNRVVSDVISFAKLQKRFAKVKIAYSAERGLKPLSIDVDQIAQLILNLLNNATDAIRDANRSQGFIILQLSSTTDGIVLAISDNGVGIAPELKNKLFSTRFTTKKDGHGFGLVTCGRILEAHQAVYEIDSALDLGTTIRVIFPLTD